jgi:nucleoside 2-deoxyribosyltransferase
VTPIIYLAGAIRDNRPDDIEWRERVIKELGGLATFLNPLGGKVYDPGNGMWTMGGIPSTAERIWKHDCWCVDHADIVLANLTALSEGYPNIGTLVEFGRATAKGALIYSIIDRDYTGHDKLKLYKLHPFLAQPSAVVFDSVGDAIAFLAKHLQMLSGENPHFGGVLNEERKAA